jgi:hypothetical protein
MYVIDDTWENVDKLSARRDERLEAWRIYPPAAERIFGEEVGVGSYQDLEAVTQAALLSAARALKMTWTCPPFVAFLATEGDVRVPQVMSRGGENITVMTDDGVEAAMSSLREGVRLRTVKAFAAVRLQLVGSSMPATGIRVISQHFKSGPHCVLSPYGADGSGLLTFERPLRMPNDTSSRS